MLNTKSHFCGEETAEEGRVKGEEGEGWGEEKNLAAMVTAIHVVDTLEQTPSLPPVASLLLSLPAWQGHGAVSYHKRRSPSLLQETQTL